MQNKKYCVIMAGGIGIRFWPLSTQKYPKQFQDILGTGRTMIQQTYDRIVKLVPKENIFVITNKEYLGICREQLPELLPENIVGEPLMKNTAACNFYMVNKIAALEPDADIIVLPADHLILKEDVFREKANLGFQLAEKEDVLITLGITPTRPDTGYGYIQFINNDKDSYFKVKTFTEKPNLEIDNGILEHARNVFVFPADLGWSDLGTWTSVYENSPKNDDGNSQNSKNTMLYNATGNLVRTTDKKKAMVIDGLRDYIIVDTDKALLICPRENDQLLKDYVADLKSLKNSEDFI